MSTHALGPTAALMPRAASVREAAEASQRGRMLVAMTDVVAEKGYGAATVADVLRGAGVSRRTFYELFDDKEACFLAAYDRGVDAMMTAITAALAEVDGWRPAVGAAIDTFMRLLAAEPGFARAYLVEVWAAGPAALARHSEVIDRFHAVVRAMHEQARADDPDIIPATDAQIAAVTGGISRVATIEVLAGRAAKLPELSEDMQQFGLAVLARRA